MHTIELNHPILEAEEGLLLGNGDLSVSIYQTADRIVWRFGKNDVWDRRLDLSDSPAPAHIDEITRGVRDEGWVNSGFIGGHGRATNAVADPKRMQELCDGWPAYARRPYPCPKPVGELAMRLPIDQRGFRITQRLLIEQGRVEIECSWDSGVIIRLSCFVAPSPNVLVVHWTVDHWTDETATSPQIPVWFSLCRLADPTIKAFASQLYARTRLRYYEGSVGTEEVTPLTSPEVREIDGHPVIEQKFYPDLRFTDGFRYALAPFITDFTLDPVVMVDSDDAYLHMHSDADVLDGWLAVAVPTSTDEGDVEGELRRVSHRLAGDPVGAMQLWAQETEARARAFWSESAVDIDDGFIEGVWYETLHARRCTYRADVIAPGLALPSTVQDYSLWHGDYHTNYNYQSPFWGDYTANHIDLADAFFPGMRYMIEIGRKLARDYWNCRGTFIQLTGYPFEVEDDPYGSGSLCRLAYMTGWVANHYWWRYLYTQDVEWLRNEGYPVILDCALFYTDFLKKWDDGRYHAFPSGQGEYFFNGSPEPYTDQPQVVRHVRYCLQTAVKAAVALDADEALRAQWQEMLDNLVVVDDFDAIGFDEEERRRYFLNSPEFISYDAGEIERPGRAPECLKMSRSSAFWAGCFGQLPWKMMIAMRNGVYDANRDFETFKKHIQRWRLPNGTIRAMGAGIFSSIGSYAESMGVLAPLQEMMLQSWDGAIRVFPVWPAHLNGSFTTLRAEGAFLVSASWQDGRVASLSIHSERGCRCRVASPWTGVAVLDEEGLSVEIAVEANHIIAFETAVGRTYSLEIKQVS